jgi:hypothetical protein
MSVLEEVGRVRPEVWRAEEFEADRREVSWVVKERVADDDISFFVVVLGRGMP